MYEWSRHLAPDRARRRTRVVGAVGAAVSLLLATPGAAAQPEPAEWDAALVSASVDAAVTAELAEKGSTDFWVVFEERADLSAAEEIEDWAERGQYVYDRLTATARASQAELVEQLSAQGADYQPFWIANAVLVRDGDLPTLQATTGLSGVAEVRADEVVELPDPIDSEDTDDGDGARITAVEWGIANIRADQVWSDFGVRGEGIVVGSIDSGVQFDHPALVAQYRGNNGDGTFDHNYNWWDPSQVCGSPSLEPCDNNGHGTHTMGTMVGDDGAGNQVGVAPGATWIAAKGCEARNCSGAALLSSGQFMLAPTDLNGENPRPELRPNIVNNSWGEANGSGVTAFYRDIVTAWTAAGIFGVFANGNDGPACDTAGSPADNLEAWAVGAYDSSNVVADFSSRGPGENGVVRPSISAPGVSVRSAYPGNRYATASGTSMATPHQSGAIALMWAAAPALVGNIDQTRALLVETAIDTEDLTCGGTPGNNNVYGEGRLDAHAAVDASPTGPTGSMSGTVTDSAGAAIAGATVRLDVDGFPRSTTTSSDGTYAFAALPVGSYEVTAKAFGYATVTEPAEVVQDQTATRGFVLAPVPSQPVSGTVTDDQGDPVEGATVTIDATPLPAAQTGADGGYGFDAVPEGSYSVTISGGGCLGVAVRELTVAGPTTLDVALDREVDRYGHTCRLEPSEWIEATDPLPPFPEPKNNFHRPFPAEVDLPFIFPFYGDFYAGSLWVTSTGYVSFLDPTVDNLGAPILTPQLPHSGLPNAAIYPFGGELQFFWGDRPGQVLTGTVGEPGERRFVVEWRDVASCFLLGHPNCDPTAGRVDFQVVLHESGEIVLQYRNLDPDSPSERGGAAIVGIENDDGTDALPFSVGQPALSDEFAIRYTPPTLSGVVGRVRDAADQEPVDRVTVTATSGEQTRTAHAGSAGGYGIELPDGTWQLEFTRARYQPVTRVVTVAGGLVPLDVALPAPAATVDRDGIELSLTAGESATVDLTLTNPGVSDLDWWTGIAPGGWSHQPGPPPGQPGEVVRAWALNEEVNGGEGASTYADSRIWIIVHKASHLDAYARELDLDGRPTGRRIDNFFRPGDGFTIDGHHLTYLADRDWLCSNGHKDEDEAVLCVDPDTGAVVGHLLLPAEVPQLDRTTGYNPDDDVFFAQGLAGSRDLYQVAGFSHQEPGRLLSHCRADDPFTSTNLSYHRASHLLWQVRNSGMGGPPTEVRMLDPDTCATVGTLPHQLPDDRDINSREWIALRYVSQGEGDSLWFSAQVNRNAGWPSLGNPAVFEVRSGLPELGEVPWLAVDQPDGTLAPGTSGQLTVTVDTTDLVDRPGVHTATVVVASDAGREPRLHIPVRVEVLPASEQDGLPPAAWAALDGEKEQQWLPDVDYLGGPDRSVQVTLDARDNYQGSGLDRIEYQLDGGDWTTYQEPLQVSEPAHHTVTFRATDQAGNTSVEESVEFTIAAGRLAADRDAVAVDVLPAGVVERTVTVTNTGSRPASLSVLRRNADPAPAPDGGATEPPEIPPEWASLPDLPERISNPLTAVVGDFLYAFGGHVQPGPQRTAMVFALDLTGGQDWVRLRDMPVIIGQSSPPPGVIDGRIYLATRNPDELWIYDPATGTWQTGATPPQYTGRAGSAVVDGQLYLIGGRGFEPAEDWVRRYDPATDSWQELPGYPLGIYFPYCGGIDGKVYCAGGLVDSGATVDTYVFDPADPAAGWQRLADLPRPLSRGAVTAANGTLFVLGGLDREADYVYHGYAYQVATDTWSELPPTHTDHPPWFSTGACGPDGIYKVGGRHVTLREIVDVLPGSFQCEQTADTEVPWLSVDGPDQPIAPGDSAEVTVRFDAGAVAEPGTYTVELALVDITPYAVEPITVTMKVVVTFDYLREQVKAFEVDDEVTRAGAARLRRAVDQAERHHDRGADHRAILVLERFKDVAADPRFVPNETARDALVADADQLVARLGDGGGDSGTANPARAPGLESVPV